jgi:pimeloyl-ACP methyl ester carboxylesterase
MRPLLASVNTPVLILNGDQDRICLPQASECLAESLGASRHHVFSGCGHAPFLSSPEQFNKEIIHFAGSIRDIIA